MNLDWRKTGILAEHDCPNELGPRAHYPDYLVQQDNMAIAGCLIMGFATNQKIRTESDLLSLYLLPVKDGWNVSCYAPTKCA